MFSNKDMIYTVHFIWFREKSFLLIPVFTHREKHQGRTDKRLIGRIRQRVY